MIHWLIARPRLVLGAMVVGAVAWVAWEIDSRAYARGVFHQKIKTQTATLELNKALRVQTAKVNNAALDSEEQRQALANLERELNDASAQDPAAAGAGLPIGELRRVFQIRRTR